MGVTAERKSNDIFVIISTAANDMVVTMRRKDPYASINENINASMEAFKADSNENHIHRALQTLRTVNLYPTPTFDEEGEVNEVIKCIRRDVSSCLTMTSESTAYLKCRYLQGLTLCRYLFPEIAHVRRKLGAKSVHDAFMDDKELFKALKYLFRTRPTFNAPQLHSVMGITSPMGFNNYIPSRMKALCEKFCPPTGVIYDYSAGFGGRMIGCLTSSLDFTYLGVDPNPDIQNNYMSLRRIIEKAYEKLNVKRSGVAQVQCVGSEDYCPQEWVGKVDFAMSCPPYWEREYYTDDPNQCYNRYKTLDEWFAGYVKPTLRNIFRLCKSGAFAGFQIMDYGKIQFVDRWLNVVQATGFEKHCIINCQIESRTGTGHDRQRTKTEKIYIYRKP